MEATPRTPPGRRPIEVGRVVSEAFEIYSANTAALLLSALAIFFVVGMLQALLSGADDVLLRLVSGVINLAAIALYTGFVVKLVEDVRDGRRDFSAGELLSSASGHFVPLAVNGVLRAVAVAIGLVLLIVPGLYLMTIWAVCAPAVAVEGKGAMEAFNRSSELVEGQKMPVFLTILVAFLITTVVNLFALSIGTALGGGALFALVIIASTITAPISALVASVLFFDLGGRSATAAADSQVVIEY
ncbi:MAG: hypothetical protein H0V25_02725 [Solirubrobacterales bacterium]|nr:hypothetical protein [Solirubrobacterales bacterium]